LKEDGKETGEQRESDTVRNAVQNHSNGNNRFLHVLPHLYCFQDTCNVYAVIKNGEAVLIDFGSGAVLDCLSEMGVERISAILHTHHHRDQCQGDCRAVELGIPVFVPAHERRLFDQAELFWATRNLWDMYDVRNTLFSLTRDIMISGVLRDFERWCWKEYEFSFIPTPGHTLGSISIVSEIDNTKVAFTGDLLYSPGKVLTLHDMQYSYSETDGLEAEILSLKNMERREPKLLCPSHGRPIEEGVRALELTRLNLTEYYKLRNNGSQPVSERPFTWVTDHLLAAEFACAFFYVLLADNGHALLIDYGAPCMELLSPVQPHFETGETIRFIEHSVDRLEAEYGVRQIDAVIPTHYHDDHVAGIPYLQSRFGTECWAWEGLRHLLESPGEEQTGCVMPYPIRVDRTFCDGETLLWREYELIAHHTPGHTEYAVSLFTTIDGKQVGFTGDNIFATLYRTPSVIYRNRMKKDSHRKAFQVYARYHPEIICGGHEMTRDVSPELYETLLSKAEALTGCFEMLLPGETNLGLDPSWAQLCPYQTDAAPGDTFELRVRLHNYSGRPVQAEARLVLPDSWRNEPVSIDLRIPADTEAEKGVKVTIPKEYCFKLPRAAIALDVTYDGTHIGQAAEAVIVYRDYSVWDTRSLPGHDN
jgi:glyoxylase-like metal-dependent hydrolase (beta-lactamase superfamily II)